MSHAPKKLIAVPTAYNIYRVSDETLLMVQGQMAMFPPAIVLETLVMQGLAKRVAVINQFDMEEEEDEDALDPEDRYDPEEEQKPKEEESEDPPVGQGPWYVRDEEDD